MTTLTLDVIARDRASKTLAGIGKTTDTTAGRFDHFKGRAVIAGAVAGAAIFKFAKDSVKAYSEAQEGQKRLTDAFERFPALADVSKGSLQKLNSALQKKTKYDDDNIASGQATLAQFKLTGSQIKDTTPLILDYASKTGKDVPAAAQDIGKALLGNAKALKNIGIKYTATGDTQTDYTNITKLMRAQVGGFAEKEGTTAAGQAAILKNQFGEVEETVGSKLVPALMALTGGLISIINFTQKYSNIVIPVVAVLGTLAGIIYTILTVTKIWTAVQAAFNIVMALNPIGLIIIGIGLLVAGMIIAYKKSETFRNIVNGVFKAVGTAVSFMWNNVIKPVFKLWINAWFTVIGAILHGAAKAFGWIPGIGPKLKAAAKKFDQFRDATNRALDGIHDRTVNVKVVASINKSSLSIQGKKNALEVAWRASGGPVKAGHPYVVGEQGPELFVPNQSGGIVPNGKTSGGSAGGGGNQYITVNLTAPGDDLSQARRLVALLQKLQQSSGKPLQIRTA